MMSPISSYASKSKAEASLALIIVFTSSPVTGPGMGGGRCEACKRECSIKDGSQQCPAVATLNGIK